MLLETKTLKEAEKGNQPCELSVHNVGTSLEKVFPFPMEADRLFLNTVINHLNQASKLFLQNLGCFFSNSAVSLNTRLQNVNKNVTSRPF